MFNEACFQETYKDVDGPLRTAVRRYLERKVDVFVFFSTENGSPVWAIAPKEHSEFWLDAKSTKEGAIEFCQNFRLRYEVLR